MRGRHPHRGLPPRRRRSSSSTVREWRRRWANGTWPPPASSMTTWLPSGPRAPRRRRRSHPSTTQRDRGLRVLEEARQECAPKTDAFALGVRLEPLHGLDLAVGLPSCAHTDHALVPLDGRGLVAEALEIRAVHAGDVLLHEGAVGRGVAGGRRTASPSMPAGPLPSVGEPRSRPETGRTPPAGAAGTSRRGSCPGVLPSSAPSMRPGHLPSRWRRPLGVRVPQVPGGGEPWARPCPRLRRLGPPPVTLASTGISPSGRV